jgi:arsenate reductase (thioredoxin)
MAVRFGMLSQATYEIRLHCSTRTMNRKKKILFLCTHNAARSQMAEGLINAHYGDRFEAYGAGVKPTEVQPCAFSVMAEIGIDISPYRAKSVELFIDSSFDYVVTMCADAQENCPIFPGGTTYLDHAFTDPVVVIGADIDRCASFRKEPLNRI